MMIKEKEEKKISKAIKVEYETVQTVARAGVEESMTLRYFTMYH